MRKSKISKTAFKEATAAYVFLLPLISGLLVFNVYSFVINIYYSLTNKKSFGIPKFIGLKNYIKMFQNDKFYTALGNTMLYVIFCVPIVVILSIIIASLLNTKVKGTGLYRTMIFIPAVTMPAAIGLLWKWLFNYEFGIINAFLKLFNVSNIAWLSDPKFALFSVSAVLIWSDVSMRMIILLAGLQGIPEVYYEAAEIDGANAFVKFLNITLPLLSPSIFFVTVMEVIGVFQIFDFIYLMIPKGSSGVSATRSLVSYFYESTFVEYNKGYGAAIAIVLFLIIMVITIIQMIAQKKWVHYE